MKKGNWFIIASAVMFSIGGLLIKMINWNAMTINGVRSILGAMVLCIYLICIKHKLVINKTVLTGAVCVAGTTLLYAIANKLTTAGNAIILEYTAPIWVMIFSALFFRVKPHKTDIAAAICILLGVVCFFIDGLSTGNMLGNILALISGIFYSGVFMMGASKDSDSLSSTFFGMCINSLIGIPFILQQDFSATDLSGLAAAICLGIFQVGLAYVFLNCGLKYTSPTSASLLGGLEPVLNPVLAAVFYGEMLSTVSMIGAAIVFVSITLYSVKKCQISDNKSYGI